MSEDGLSLFHLIMAAWLVAIPIPLLLWLRVGVRGPAPLALLLCTHVVAAPLAASVARSRSIPIGGRAFYTSLTLWLATLAVSPIYWAYRYGFGACRLPPTVCPSYDLLQPIVAASWTLWLLLATHRDLYGRPLTAGVLAGPALFSALASQGLVDFTLGRGNLEAALFFLIWGGIPGMAFGLSASMLTGILGEERRGIGALLAAVTVAWALALYWGALAA